MDKGELKKLIKESIREVFREVMIEEQIRLLERVVPPVSPDEQVWAEDVLEDDEGEEEDRIDLTEEILNEAD